MCRPGATGGKSNTPPHTASFRITPRLPVHNWDKVDILLYQPFLAGLQDRFTQRFRITATIGFGTIYPQLSLVSISYMQASQKIRGRSLKDDGKILYHMEEDDGSRFYQQIRNYFPRFRSSALS